MKHRELIENSMPYDLQGPTVSPVGLWILRIGIVAFWVAVITGLVELWRM